jgi:hypothetical protein
LFRGCSLALATPMASIQLAVPVLQAKLKLKLGNEYKKIVGATKKKPELLALYMQYCT